MQQGAARLRGDASMSAERGLLGQAVGDSIRSFAAAVSCLHPGKARANGSAKGRGVDGRIGGGVGAA